MTDTKKLKSKMLEHDITIEQLATILGLSRNQLGKKINGNAVFTQKEILAISVILGLSKDETIDIFLSKNFAIECV